MATQRIDLSWHVVCGRYEMEELERYQVVKQHEYSDPRHKLFDDLKWSHHTKWQGSWGPEPLYYDKVDDLVKGQLGIIYATDKRAEEIRKWIRDQMFNIAPGND